jgi:hypothetical protein
MQETSELQTEAFDFRRLAGFENEESTHGAILSSLCSALKVAAFAHQTTLMGFYSTLVSHRTRAAISLLNKQMVSEPDGVKSR